MKKILAVLIVFLLALSFESCGKKNNEKDAPESNEYRIQRDAPVGSDLEPQLTDSAENIVEAE